MYSQNNEEEIIFKYFGPEFKGLVLDIGANDGKTLSNSFACIERGWRAYLLEPSEKAFDKLEKLHEMNHIVSCLKFGIGKETGVVEFFSSGSHLNESDSDLLSTFKESETKRWAGTKNEFKKEKAWLLTFKDFCKTYVRPQDYIFDLITIDVEGLDYDVLTQIDLKEHKVKMLIVETNSVDDQKYIDYCLSFGMKIHHKNHENLIFVL